MPLPVLSSSSLLWLLKLKLTLISTALHLINSNSSMLLPSPKDMANNLRVMDNLSRAIMPHLSIRMALLAAEAHPTLKAIRLLTNMLLSLTATRADLNLKLLKASDGNADLLSDPVISLPPISSIPTGVTRVSQTRKLSPPAHSTSLVTLTLKAALSLSRNLTILLPSSVSSRASSPVFTP